MIVTKTGVKGVKKKVTLEFIAWVLTDFSSFAAFNSFESCWVLLSNSWITRRESCNETTQHGCQQPRRILTLGAKTKTKREQVSVGDNLTTELPFSSLAFYRLTVESTRQARRASRARDEALTSRARLVQALARYSSLKLSSTCLKCNTLLLFSRKNARNKPLTWH